MGKKFGLFILASGLVGSAHGTLILGSVDITGGTSSQSSNFSGFSPIGAEAIDGNLGNFSHTGDGDTAPTWNVDFGVDNVFNQIVLHNRDSCCGNRLADVTVQVFDNSSNEIYNSGVLNPGGTLGSPAFMTLDFPTLSNGRSITVSRLGTSTVGGGNYLALGEVLINGVTDQILPLGTNLTQANITTMTTTQSSQLSGFSSNLAVDGNTGNFTHTVNTDTTPSWEVDFGEEMSLEQVSMLTRVGCCGGRLRDITVRVLDAGGITVFTSSLINPENAAGFGGGGGGQLDLDLMALNGGSPILGQTVVISRTGDPDSSGTGVGDSPGADDSYVISLAEVQVIGGTYIPEPASLALLGLAGVSLMIRRRR